MEEREAGLFGYLPVRVQAGRAEDDIEALPLPCFLRGIDSGRPLAVERPAALPPWLAAIRVEDLDLVPALQADATVPAGDRVTARVCRRAELDVQVAVPELLLARDVAAARRRDAVAADGPVRRALAAAPVPVRGQILRFAGIESDRSPRHRCTDGNGDRIRRGSRRARLRGNPHLCLQGECPRHRGA